jgi:hypothetical protein
MRWQLAPLFAVTAMSAGCYEPATVECGDDFLCPAGTVCAEPGFCGASQLVSQCFEQDKPAYAACSYVAEGGNEAPGVCLHGVCSECVPDRAGCATAAWSSMLTPTAPLDLFEIWVVPPAAGQPVTDAWAGGVVGTMLRYNGETWTYVADFPSVAENIDALWGTDGANVYAAAGTKLFHFDGASWSMVALPSGGDALKDISGTSATDVYAVGISQTIYHFDGTAWTLLSSSGPTLEAVVATGQGAIAVGPSGVVSETDGTSAPALSTPFPSPFTNASMMDIFVRDGVVTVVGQPLTGGMPVVERRNGTWVNASPSSADVSLFAGWGRTVVGNQGTILRHDGNAWIVEPQTPTTNTLLGVSGAGNETFIVGDGGLIFRRTL